MKSYRKSLPPLDSLLFFNAVANNRSLNSAAEELFVTQAAVSKRIQRFEEWLGTPLFSRDGRALQITEAGTSLAESTLYDFGEDNGVKFPYSKMIFTAYEINTLKTDFTYPLVIKG